MTTRSGFRWWLSTVVPVVAVLFVDNVSGGDKLTTIRDGALGNLALIHSLRYKEVYESDGVDDILPSVVDRDRWVKRFATASYSGSAKIGEENVEVVTFSLGAFADRLAEDLREPVVEVSFAPKRGWLPIRFEIRSADKSAS